MALPITLLLVLIAVTAMLISEVAFRPGVTASPSGKILAFFVLFLLPLVCAGMGTSYHVERSKSTAFCLSCQVVEQISRKTGSFAYFRSKGRRNFSAVQAAWRSAQSRANYSPPEFPANRENNREFPKILTYNTALLLSKLHILLEKHPDVCIEDESKQGIIRGVSGSLFP